MVYTYANNMKSVIIDSMSQFQSDDTGANVGVGFTGFDQAIAYAYRNNLDCFCAIFPAFGDDDTPMAFNYGMWTWVYHVRFYIRFRVDSEPTSDQIAMDLDDEFMSTILDATNCFTIVPSGHVKVVAANYLSEAETINEVVYITRQYLVHVKQQIER